jgi:serine/threonine protein kinase
MCAGLDAAHSHHDDDGRPRPILHRDVSPHNLLLGVNGAMKITDFGIAKASTSLEAKFTASVLRGKLPYMAPEYIQDGSGDHRIDIFAAGLSLYFALTKRHPFYKSGGDAAIFQAVLDGQVPPPSASRRDIPAAIDDIVMCAIAPDPAKRFSSARAMQSELEAFLIESSLPASFADVAEWLSRLRAEHAARPSPRPAAAAASSVGTLPTERDAAIEFARARKLQ